MHKPTTCTLLYIAMYAGIALFLYPYISGHLSSGSLFLIGGAAVTVLSGLARAFLQDGDCDQRTNVQRIP